MDLALITSAALLGLAGTPHCAAMCAAPCAAASTGQGVAGRWGFQFARVASYAAAGALAASSVSALAALGQVAPAVRPLWTMLHAAALALGLWLTLQGRQPAWMGRWGRVQAPATGCGGTSLPRAPSASEPGAVPVHLQPLLMQTLLQTAAAGPGAAPALKNPAGQVPPARATSDRTPWPAVSAGLLWAAWPCGLLQSALLMAALSSGAAAGAAAMAGFALASSAGLLMGPWAWRRWLSGPGAARRERSLTRLGGAMLAAGSAWGLSHDLWPRVAAWCGLA